MPLRSGLVTKVNDMNVSVANIPVKNSLTINIAQHSHNTGDSCHVDNPAFVMCKLDMVDPAGNKGEVGSITNAELFPGGNCKGDFVKEKSFNPLGPQKGNYVFIFSGDRATLHPAGRDFIFYPSIQIVADGKIVVDNSYPSPGGEQGVQDVFVVTAQ